MKSALVCVAALFLHLAFSAADAQEHHNVVLTGAAPLDTSWPGSSPELLAPGVVNTDGVEINLVFDLDYTELFFARTVDKVFFIFTCRVVDGTWTAPERLDIVLQLDGGGAR
jgi:hypothetical protein